LIRHRHSCARFIEPWGPVTHQQVVEEDVGDINALSEAVRTGTNALAFDVTQDGLVNEADRVRWVRDLKKTWFGDVDLDGTFTSGDFVLVFQKGQYEDATVRNSNWEDGDWNGDGDFTSGDFVTAFQDGGFEMGLRPSVSAVPEPSLATLFAAAMLPLMGACRSRRVMRS
jgi:hypothetical protein